MSLDRRLRALEARRPQLRGGFHCLQWWPGMGWDDVLARHGNPDGIRPGDRVKLIRFGGAGEAFDPIMVRDAQIAADWLQARGAVDA